MKSDGPPERNFWDANRIASSQSESSLFRLRTATLPELERKKDKRKSNAASVTQGEDADEDQDGQQAKEGGDGSPAMQDLSTSAGEPGAEAPTNQKAGPRSQKYYGLLMKHHNKRVDGERKALEVEEKDRREAAARLATRRALKEEARRNRDDSESDSSDSSSGGKEKEEEGDYGALTAYEGAMKVDIEVVVMGAPKEKGERRRRKDKDQEGRRGSGRRGSGRRDSGPKEKRMREIILPSGETGYVTDSPAYSPTASTSEYSTSSGGFSSAPSSSSSASASSSKSSTSQSTPRMDIAAELEQLQEEVGADTDSSSGSDGLPDDLLNRQKQNIWDNPDMRWTLGIGGTVFFVPDAERYGHAPSLPPPPPQNLIGRRKVHMKPRLPLEISNHRYRDEHPNIWPEDPYNPTKNDKKSFEQKLMTLDFYASCSKAMTRLPPLEREKDGPKHEDAFGGFVQKDTRSSIAWRTYLEKERRRRKKEAERRMREAADQAAAAAAAVGPGAQQQTGVLGAAGLVASPSVASQGLLGLPSGGVGPMGAPR